MKHQMIMIKNRTSRGGILMTGKPRGRTLIPNTYATSFLGRSWVGEQPYSLAPSPVKLAEHDIMKEKSGGRIRHSHHKKHNKHRFANL